MRIRPYILCLLLGLAASPASAQGTDIDPAASWTRPWFTRLDVGFPDGIYHARWDYHRCDCGDVLIRTEETLPEGLVTGEQVLVAGRVLLQRGFDQAGPAHLDSPMLMLQLLLVLLQKAGPAGPASVDAPYVITASDDDGPLSLDTGTAHGAFPPPWSVVGEVRGAGDGSHRFGMEFRFDKNSRGGSELSLSGELDYRSQAFPFAGDMSLADWSVHPLNAEDDKLLADRPANTLAELREMLRTRDGQ